MENNNYQIINNYINFVNQYVESVNSTLDYMHTSNRNLRIMERNLNSYITNYLLNNNVGPADYNEENYDYYNGVADNNGYANNNQIQYNAQNENQYIENINNYRAISNQNLLDVLNNSITIENYSDIENPLNDTCTITHDTFNPDDEVACLNHCKHIFKFQPLFNWLNQHQTCPVCRHNILDETDIFKYSNGDGEILFLTRNQFRYFLVNTIANTIVNHNTLDSSNNRVIFSVIR